MTQQRRILIAIVVIAVLVGGVLGLEALRRQESVAESGGGGGEAIPGSVPIYVDGEEIGRFAPDDLAELEEVSFTEPEEGKKQQGWLLRDILLLYVDEGSLQDDALITVSSSSREKSAQVSWAEAAQKENMVMFDVSNRGTLKLVSQQLAQLDERNEWVQDADKIEVATP